MGTVFLVHHRISDPSAPSPFALKVVDKSLLHFKCDADRRARWEIAVLSSFTATHPFLPTLLGSFETQELLGWALPFCPGGDLNGLRFHQPDRVFSPTAIKFYLAEIICALEYLHSVGIAYRDLKPENVLVQSSGHVTLTDFDLCQKLTHRKIRVRTRSDPDLLKEFKPPPPPLHPHPTTAANKPVRRKNLMRILSYGSGLEMTQKKTKSAKVSPAVSRQRMSFAGGKRSNSFVGTEEYVSPEVVKGEGHEYGVDWWALGVLAYEMLYGKTPFRGQNRKETFRNILMKQPEFVGKRTALIDLIEGLLQKDPSKRLGHFRGAAEVKEHEFFKGLAWDLLTEVRPPFVPDDEGETAKLTEGFDIREYFLKQRAPSSMPSSPRHSDMSSAGDDDSITITEF
ncbi:hypothetical protein Cgig2_002303 [Carnegiea gigantea]|uniref:non-specific serine/threonine protein kinase n=1 Tax=Carnegiea gigantea TaxID=171969 RepID=A0A9Q1QQ13_9CARY|nr:hypothetical protein Cgig2_002303 [Carnegiea gigantea]